jgi:hypothetical protein
MPNFALILNNEDDNLLDVWYVAAARDMEDFVRVAMSDTRVARAVLGHICYYKDMVAPEYDAATGTVTMDGLAVDHEFWEDHDCEVGKSVHISAFYERVGGGYESGDRLEFDTAESGTSQVIKVVPVWRVGSVE